MPEEIRPATDPATPSTQAAAEPTQSAPQPSLDKTGDKARANAVAKAAVEDTKRAVDGLVERIYATQKAGGLWPVDDATIPAVVADMHSMISTGYIAWTNDLVEDTSEIFARIAIACLGVCRHMGHNVGGVLLNEVIAQAWEVEQDPVAREGGVGRSEAIPRAADSMVNEDGAANADADAETETDADADEDDEYLLSGFGTDEPDMKKLLEEIEAEERQAEDLQVDRLTRTRK